VQAPNPPASLCSSISFHPYVSSLLSHQITLEGGPPKAFKSLTPPLERLFPFATEYFYNKYLICNRGRVLKLSSFCFLVPTQFIPDSPHRLCGIAFLRSRRRHCGCSRPFLRIQKLYFSVFIKWSNCKQIFFRWANFFMAVTLPLFFKTWSGVAPSLSFHHNGRSWVLLSFPNLCSVGSEAFSTYTQLLFVYNELVTADNANYGAGLFPLISGTIGSCKLNAIKSYLELSSERVSREWQRK